MDDKLLLQQYVRDDSESAFRQLVERHVNIVYAAAVRRVGDPTLAQDVVQVVFLLLAKKAKKLPSQVVLSGWLYRTTYFVATKALRSERRRKYHEREAVQMHSLTVDPPDNTWKKLAPFLDESLIRLGDKDRNAILLRYFEEKDLATVGAALGLSEDAAQKRVSRALDKLRRLIRKRGMVVTGAVLGTTLAAHGAAAPPLRLLGQSIVSNCLHQSVVAPGIYALLQESLRQYFWATFGKATLAALPIVACAFVLAHHLPKKTAEIQVASLTGPKNNTVAPKKKVVLASRSAARVDTLNIVTVPAASRAAAKNVSAALPVSPKLAASPRPTLKPKPNLDTNAPLLPPQVAQAQDNSAVRSVARMSGGFTSTIKLPSPIPPIGNVATNQIGIITLPVPWQPSPSDGGNGNRRFTPTRQTGRPSSSPSRPSPGTADQRRPF